MGPARHMWLTPRHLEGGTAEIRFVMGPGRVWRVAYITTKCTKRNAGGPWAVRPPHGLAVV